MEVSSVSYWMCGLLFLSLHQGLSSLDLIKSGQEGSYRSSFSSGKSLYNGGFEVMEKLAKKTHPKWSRWLQCAPPRPWLLHEPCHILAQPMPLGQLMKGNTAKWETHSTACRCPPRCFSSPKMEISTTADRGQRPSGTHRIQAWSRLLLHSLTFVTVRVWGSLFTRWKLCCSILCPFVSPTVLRKHNWGNAAKTFKKCDVWHQSRILISTFLGSAVTFS
jgi:hypothetical protein